MLSIWSLRAGPPTDLISIAQRVRMLLQRAFSRIDRSSTTFGQRALEYIACGNCSWSAAPLIVVAVSAELRGAGIGSVVSLQ